ncbi:ATP-binding cassette subfamily B protein [Tamaricihabitans halophyticus]|uniref:ATP-binding cassette subfamily B protein n=1 Tax=Tamaricihabitans halophyticus TaxID=1262583 RepID=A0A4R2QSM5_9PSEU|nr:ABC transporter ATP-binding protein [Tamaricihabitans halophyticus]TCP49995.1 ATP-binding cassette subfamily B protein [Tamaricihabitans halophyticus]
MILRLYGLVPQLGLMLRIGALQASLAILQGLLLGTLIPILRALLRPEPDFAAATPWFLLAGIGLLVYGVLAVISTPIAFTANMEFTAKLRHRLMNHVAALPLGWFTQERKARLARAVTADAGAIAHLAVTIGGPAITATLVPTTIIGVTFAVDWRMALLFLTIMPIAFLALRRAGRIVSIADEELEEAATHIAGRAIELGQAQPVLRAAGQGSTGTTRMRAALDEHRETYRRGLRKSMLPDLTYTAVVMGGFAAILIAGMLLLIGGELPIADLVALLVLAVRFLEPLGNLIELIGALRAMDNGVGRVRAVLNTEPLPTSPRPVRELSGIDIALSGVTFSYGGSARALTDVTANFPAGSTTALVGPSGSGKTTVTRLIARFFDVDSGSVRIGGTDVRDFDPTVLLNDIAIVFQDVYLFDDTIEENLRIARPDASRTELEEAARAARLDEVLNRLPAGWATRVGEAGSRLSGGERQRVSIARAFLKRSRIVLIDEAASALDPENERAVSDAIAELASAPDRTVLIIAHKPSTLRAADQVVTLDEGHVVEVGDPTTLRESGGLFAKLYDQYEQARGWRIMTTVDN